MTGQRYMTFYTYDWGHPFAMARRLAYIYIYFFFEESASDIQDIWEIAFIMILFMLCDY